MIILVLQNLLMEQNNLIASTLLFDENPIIIGVDKNCNFVMQAANNRTFPINEETAVYLLRLLNIEYYTFYHEIEKLVSKVNDCKSEISITASNFPFATIVKAALNSERDYWIELSIPWLTEIGKNCFLEDIKGILKNKNISQRIRHLLLKI